MPNESPGRTDPAEWNGFFPGDVLDYRGGGKFYIYRGPYAGGPGRFGMEPEPAFGLDHPVDPDRVFFLRETVIPFPADSSVDDIHIAEKGGCLYPETTFGENAPPIPDMAGGTLIGFLNGGPGDFRKVGHVTPEQWEEMKQKALAGRH